MSPPTGASNGVHDNVNRNWICANNNCKLAYNDSKKQYWLVCAICEDKFDSKCQNMEEKVVKALYSRADLFWLCEHCMIKSADAKAGTIRTVTVSTSPQLAYQIDNIETSIKKLVENHEAVTKDIDGLSTKLDNFGGLNINREDIAEIDTKWDKIGEAVSSSVQSKIQTALSENQTKWTDIVKNIDKNSESNNQITFNHMKKALSEISEKEKEMEKRAKGIVIYNAPEKKHEDTMQARRDDEDLIEDLLRKLGIPAPEIVDMNRLGKYDENRKKPRPIKVRFSSNKIRDEVLANLKELKNAPIHLRKLSIRQDLSEEQRRELNAKLKEAYDLTQISDYVHRVRGSPGNYYIKPTTKKTQPVTS